MLKTLKHRKYFNYEFFKMKETILNILITVSNYFSHLLFYKRCVFKLTSRKLSRNIFSFLFVICHFFKPATYKLVYLKKTIFAIILKIITQTNTAT